MKKYDEIKFKDLDWYVIDIDGDRVKLLLKNILDEDTITKCVDDEWYRNKQYVRHTSCVRPPFDWSKSYIKNTVLPKFKELLNVECEIDLLSKEEVEALPDNIRKSNDWYWTKTNASDQSDKFAYAFYVYDGGGLYDNDVYFNDGVRPAVSLDTSSLQTKKKGDKNPFVERTLPSKIDIENKTEKELVEETIKGFNAIIEYLEVSNEESNN